MARIASVSTDSGKLYLTELYQLIYLFLRACAKRRVSEKNDGKLRRGKFQGLERKSARSSKNLSCLQGVSHSWHAVVGLFLISFLIRQGNTGVSVLRLVEQERDSLNKSQQPLLEECEATKPKTHSQRQDSRSVEGLDTSHIESFSVKESRRGKTI